VKLDQSVHVIFLYKIFIQRFFNFDRTVQTIRIDVWSHTHLHQVHTLTVWCIVSYMYYYK